MNKKYCVTGQDTFGLNLENIEDCGPNDRDLNIVDTDDPRKALEAWFRLCKKFPMCTDICTTTKAYERELLEAATAEYLTELYEKYPIGYKLEYLINSVQDALTRGKSGLIESEFGDSIFPFCSG